MFGIPLEVTGPELNTHFFVVMIRKPHGVTFSPTQPFPAFELQYINRNSKRYRESICADIFLRTR